MVKSKKNVVNYYNQYREHKRLISGYGQLEKIRTEYILKRFLPKPPAVIVDIGGGTGAYAFSLAKKGYKVHLIDLVPKHIEKAKMISKKSKHKLASITVGDARKIKLKDKSADVVLMLGPLYHLTNKKDRIKAIKEAYRILKPQGLLFAVIISRFVSFIDGVVSGYIKDPDFVKIIKGDLKNGQHRNPKNKPKYFTTSFFQHPKEFIEELEKGNFKNITMMAIEGPTWVRNIEEYVKDKKTRKNILSFIEKMEKDPYILGGSPHIMAIAKKS